MLKRILIGLALGAPLAAQTPREKLVVTPQWLNEHLNDKKLVVLHLGNQASYDTAHIAGARLVDMNALTTPSAPGVLTLELPNADTLRAGLARMGISDDSHIVLYAVSPNITMGTRALLTLDHAGLGDNTVWLDGGLGAWTRAGYRTTAEVPAAMAGTLSSLRTKSVTVNADFVKDIVGKPGFALIDARATGFFDGTQESGPPDARRRGHINGAVNVPFSEMTNAVGVLKPAADLQELFTKAGVKPGDTVVAYCHIGQQATALLFGARTLGYKILLYDGSFEDWARRDLPIAGPPGE